MPTPFILPAKGEVRLINNDNMAVELNREFYDLVVADYVYENLDFSWATKFWNVLKPNGIFIAMTDHHSVTEFDYFMKHTVGAVQVNQIVWKNEWGNFPKNKFRQCHDYILIYCKGKEWNFYPERVQVPKVTANAKGLNKSGRMTKLATSWWDDICLTTVSSERVRKKDGHLVRWQKPIALLDRVIVPFINVGDWVCDPFAGVATAGMVAIQRGYNYTGIESDPEVYDLGIERLRKRMSGEKDYGKN